MVGCVGSELSALPDGFAFPENYPSEPVWSAKAIWKANQQGLYGPGARKKRYVAAPWRVRATVGL